MNYLIIGVIIAFIIGLVGMLAFPSFSVLMGTVDTTGFLPWEISFKSAIPYLFILYFVVLALAAIKKGGQ